MNAAVFDAVYLKTTSGQVIFVSGAGKGKSMDDAIAMARKAEGIEGEPDPNATLQDSGIAEFATGIPAWEKLDEYKRGK